MSADSLDEYRSKLQKSKQQLKKVKQLLTQQPHNENLLTLKRDLQEVIDVTENLILKKQEKAFDASKQQHDTDKHSNKTNTDDAHSQHTHTNSHLHGNSDSKGTFTLTNNSMFVQNQQSASNSKPTPREWGVQKEEYDIGERCQVKWQKKWVIGKVLRKAAPNERKSPKQEVEHYHVRLMQKGYEVVFSVDEMRTYVAPLREQLHIGDKVKAMWQQDERFYVAVIEEEIVNANTNEIEYRIKFEKYNEYALVQRHDIQLFGKNAKENGNADGSLNSSLVKRDDRSGALLIAEKASIPQNLWSKDDDTPDQRKKKRKKIKSIKRQHRDLKLEVESKNRANEWLRFKSKSLKKGKKKLQSTLLSKDKAKSIFENPSASNAASSIIDTNANMTQFKQRTHFHHLRKDPKHYKQ